ncbi:MAG: chromosome segregation protein SMC [Thermoplasmata archaeon]|nr:chromosome segregation protein SMC [Thermoplasmata archaeon]MCI4359354.1 chromosome segregation protein SMC [Thermoplasmata archaeon]
MHLKRVKVRNFKSFSGATEIPFQAGFTGIAGPNGMGKSNISDAILFVLGPTSSKALRAERLTHLFFNGGSSKKPATECEVSLVFDNQDRMLPVETEEVEITRYVKLTSNDPDGYYSYFYVNGRRSTQTEIDSLLAHGRLSGDGYNLVQQGDVNRIVSIGPIPRRSLVERLAGISQYDDELGKADAKRTDLESNLARINTLLGEIKGHLAALESQRLQAIQYKQLQDQKRHAEARLARAGHLLARTEVASCEAQLKKVQSDLAALRGQTQKLEDERAALAQSIDKAELEIARQGGTEAAKFKADLDERRMAFARLDENVRTAEEELTAIKARSGEFSTQLTHEEKEGVDLRSREKALAARAKEVDARVGSLSAELKEATARTDPSQGKLAGIRKDVLQTEKELEDAQRRWEALVTVREAAKAALQTSERDLAVVEDDRATREIELKDAELRTREASGTEGGGKPTPEMQKELFQVRAKETSLRAEGERLGREVLELNRRYMALDARLKVRAEKGGSAGAIAAVDFLLSQRNLGKVSGIRGTVHELINFEPQHTTALTIAAGNRFQALVVETDQVAEECIQLLRAEKRGRATFLPLNRILPGRPKGKSLVAAQSPGSLGFAIDLVRFDEEIRPALWYVFGETVVMDDLGRARSQMGGVRLVTLQGDLIEATGAITGGYLDLSKGPSADTATDLKRLGEELREKTAAESAAKADLEQLGVRVRSLSEELAKRSGQADARAQTRDVLAKDLTTARDRLKECAQRLRQVQEGRATAEKALARVESDSETLSKTLLDLKASRDRLQQDYLGQLPAALSKRIQSLHESNQAANEERTQVAGELEAARASQAAATKALAARRAELASLARSLADKSRQLDALRRSRDAAKESLEALRSVEAKQSARVQGLTEERRRLDERRLKVAALLGTSQEALRTKVDLEHSEGVRLETARTHLAEVEATLQELPEPEDDAPVVPLEELKRSIQTFQAQLDGMGSVNLLALEEYDAEKTRLAEFDSEVSRLGHEKAELTDLVGEIEKKKREKLTSVTVQVDQGFRQIYGELSGGGEGEIALENPADPLAGGLLIKARPVGKNVQRLEQLSGGEKSLASLAFIFALQRYDPSPLYVFDEVDMSLDGVNAENVGRMLRRNSERAQFIVISLRKVTLKFANHLFGVTMHGDGCSRVVGLKLDEIVDVDERDRGPEPRAAEAVALVPGAA